MRLTRLAPLAALLVTTLLGTAAPAFADATAFIGGTTTPSNRQVKGAAFGIGLLVVGFEFEYANSTEDPLKGAPRLRTGMGNVLLQTPFAIMGLQPYFTTGGGIYRETLGTHQETQFGVNTGGGVKIALLGPLRARLDYRVFRLKGDPLFDTVHRVYAGVTVKF
jgi:opacity protein-like surface antigen